MEHNNKTMKAMLKFQEDFGISPASQGQYAAGNRGAFDAIERGTAHRATEVKIMNWLKAERKTRRKVKK